MRESSGEALQTAKSVEVMAQHDRPDTLHHLDPPYVPDARPRRGSEREMSRAGRVELLERARELRGMVAISGYRNALYDNVLAGWTRLERATYADGARPRVKSLWLNPAAAREMRQASLFAGDVQP